MSPHGLISRLAFVLLFANAQRVVSRDVIIHAINPTSSGQIGVNPVSVYEITTTAAPSDPIVTTTVILPTATHTIVSPWAVITEPNGDVAFPVTEDGKAALQSMFDQVAAACAGKTKFKRGAISKRSGSCELEQFKGYGTSGGHLDFDFEWDISIPTFTAGDVAVALQGVRAAVIVAFIAYVIGNGKVSDSTAPKAAASQIAKTTVSSTKSGVPTTTPDDQPDSIYTAADAVYDSIAQVVLAQITADASADSVLWGLAPTAVPIPHAKCDMTKLTDMDASVFRDLATSFCTNIDLGKDTSKVLTNSDAGTTNFAGYTFHMDWKSKGDCGGTKCYDIFSQFSSNCAYNSHYLYKTGSIDLTCGSASYEIDPPGPTSTTAAAPAPTSRPTVSNSCADTTVYTKFTRDQALAAIEDFCGQDINLPNAAVPVSKTYKDNDVTLQLDVHWSSSGQDGCFSPDKIDSHLSGDDCHLYFQSAVDNCNTDTTDNKYGQKPFVWNSPNGCIDFDIYGDGVD